MIRPTPPADSAEAKRSAAPVPRLFLREPGWKVGHKLDSQREFCFQVQPGEDAYHRIAQGELYIYSPDERLCLPCADRRGLIQFEPGRLRSPILGAPVTPEDNDDTPIPVLDRYGVAPDDQHEPPSVRS